MISEKLGIVKYNYPSFSDNFLDMAGNAEYSLRIGGVDVNQIAKRLRAVRDSTGLNQKDFAASLGLSKTTYNGYETGNHEPRSDLLIKIATNYNVTVDYLIGRSDNPDSRPSTISLNAQRIALLCDKLSDEGQAKVEDYAQDLVDSGKYNKGIPGANNGEKTG